jgi:hypothetical protein
MKGTRTVVSNTSSMLMPSIPTANEIPAEDTHGISIANCVVVTFLSNMPIATRETTSSTMDAANATTFACCGRNANRISAANKGQKIRKTVSIVVVVYRTIAVIKMRITPITIIKI